MAKTIKLAAGGYVTRSWSGDGFKFEVGIVDNSIPNDLVVIRPTRREMLAIGALFRRTALKAKKSEEKIEYEAPTLTYLGRHDVNCESRTLGNLAECTCGLIKP